MSRMRMSPASYMADKYLGGSQVLFQRLVIRTSRLRDVVQIAPRNKWVNSGLPWDRIIACPNFKPDDFAVRPSLVMTRYKLGGIP